LLLGHGALAVLLGLFAGFGLAIHVLGEFRLWPLPGVVVALPGTARAWSAAHIGPILNGVLCLSVGLGLPHLPVSFRALRWVAWSMVAMVWGNACFYVFSILGTNRGLSVGSERFGPGNVFDFLAYVPALVAAVAAIVTMILIARAAFSRGRS
jgi:styrene-oxide isomerase